MATQRGRFFVPENRSEEHLKPKKKRASPWFCLAAVCLLALVALAVPYFTASTAASSVVPSPRGLPPSAQQQIPGLPDVDERFPVVDWDYWQEINPAIVAWVSVPDTHIDYAVVQAPKDNPTYYLTHDIYGNWNPYGCPYIDADCDGITGSNIVVFGHNMGYDHTMFSDFANFSDRDFAISHDEIYFQTSHSRRILQVSSVAIIPGFEQSKRTDFADSADLDTWYQERYAVAAVQLQNNQDKHQLFTFVTCSYHYFSNERTLVYAQ
jgi:sortase B